VPSETTPEFGSQEPALAASLASKQSPVPSVPPGERPIFLSQEYDKFTAADMPGLPKPLSGERFIALKGSIQEHGGLITPIQVDRDHRVWDGRSRLAACRELGLPVHYAYIPEGADGFSVALAGSLTREWTIIEQARFVHWVSQHVDDLKIQRPTGMKKRDAIGGWLTNHLGWKRSVSGPSIDQFIAISSAYDTEEFADKRAEFDAAESLHDAVQIMKRSEERVVSGTVFAPDPRKTLLRQVVDKFSFENEVSPDDELRDLIQQVYRLLARLAPVQELPVAV
jgi:hypothetical protein